MSLGAWAESKHPRDNRGRFAGAGPGDLPSSEALGIKTPKVAEFHAAFSKAFSGSEFQHHVTHYTPEQLSGMKLFSTADGKAGVAVHDHGDGRIEATALFNQGATRGAGLALLKHAIEHAGANYVECYGPKLNTLYKKLGFKDDSSSRFNKEYAASKWNYRKFDSPNYHTMKLGAA